MLKCGITGGTGVLGKRIIEQLPYKFFLFKKKIENFNQVKKWINSQKFDLILHLAAIVPTNKVKKNLKKANVINVDGTKNILKAVLNKPHPPKWFFYASTSHVYSTVLNKKKISENSKIKPYSKYGQTKRDAEKNIEKNFKNKKISFCVGRIFSFTDKRQKPPYVIPSLIAKIKNAKQKKVILSNLNHYRDFISTKDIASAINILFRKNKKGFYNIGNGNKVNIKTIAKIIGKKYKKKVIFLKNNKPTYLVSDNNKLKKVGWKPKKFNRKINYFY